ncbi:hypothetical protein ACFE04_021803 [Oxalis oulophora]
MKREDIRLPLPQKTLKSRSDDVVPSMVVSHACNFSTPMTEVDKLKGRGLMESSDDIDCTQDGMESTKPALCLKDRAHEWQSSSSNRPGRQPHPPPYVFMSSSRRPVIQPPPPSPPPPPPPVSMSNDSWWLFLEFDFLFKEFGL